MKRKLTLLPVALTAALAGCPEDYDLYRFGEADPSDPVGEVVTKNDVSFYASNLALIEQAYFEEGEDPPAVRLGSDASHLDDLELIVTFDAVEGSTGIYNLYGMPSSQDPGSSTYCLVNATESEGAEPGMARRTNMTSCYRSSSFDLLAVDTDGNGRADERLDMINVYDALQVEESLHPVGGMYESPALGIDRAGRVLTMTLDNATQEVCEAEGLTWLPAGDGSRVGTGYDTCKLPEEAGSDQYGHTNLCLGELDPSRLSELERSEFEVLEHTINGAGGLFEQTYQQSAREGF